MRRTNRERTEATRLALLDGARALFAERGYSETATPDIAAAADVTRGALYHHFEDKRAIFRAVAEREAALVKAEILGASDHVADPRGALLAGARGYFTAMRAPGRTRLLLLDGPAVLGPRMMAAIDGDNAEATLRDGVAALLQSSGRHGDLLDPLTALLSAAFDRAALEIAAGADADRHEQAIALLLGGLG